MNSNWKLLPAALLVAVLAIAGCGGSGTPDEPPMASAYDTGLAAINAADTAEAAQAAYDDVDQTAVTGDEANKLMAALNTRLSGFRAAAQMAALAAAAGAIDTSDLSTQDAIDAANVAIGVLQMALDDATDVSDTSMYSAQLAAAQTAVQAAVVELARQGRIANQKSALMSAAGAVDTIDLSTRDGIAAAKMAIAGLQAALDAAVDVSAADRAMYQSQLDGATTAVGTAEAALDLGDRQDVQRMALDGALDAAGPAVRAVDNDSTDAEVNAADMALATLKTAIDEAADLPGTEVGEAKGTYDTLVAQLNSAKERRTAAMNAKDDADNEAMAALAAKLYAGISAPMGAIDGTAATTRAAAYNAADTAITVNIGDGTAANAVDLSEDKDAMVTALKGWQGKRYHRTMPASEGTYEAYVYSHVGDATQGDKFGQIGVTTPSTGYEYGLDANGVLVANGGDAFTYVAAEVASSSFDQSAGVKSFELGTNRQYVSISGTYHGVSGEYRCEPATDNTCAVQRAASGFDLGGAAAADNAFTAAGGVWTFRPSNTEARVTDTPDANYASYGWWLHKSDDDATYTASAFHDYKGTDEDALGATALTNLRGTATYSGGAAGKYALSSTTGGTNDAGHFTADATLEAEFASNADATGSAHVISGTIDNFMGSDGMMRDWTVELNEVRMSDQGAIVGTANGDAFAADNPYAGTVWTIGEEAAKTAGRWSGQMHELGDDGVPAVATGTFYTEYGRDGRMVGGFGATTE